MSSEPALMLSYLSLDGASTLSFSEILISHEEPERSRGKPLLHRMRETLQVLGSEVSTPGT